MGRAQGMDAGKGEAGSQKAGDFPAREAEAKGPGDGQQAGN